MSRLDDIKARLAAATPGPWCAQSCTYKDDEKVPEGFKPGWRIFGPPQSMPRGRFLRDGDAQLIIHMRKDMALLLPVVEATLGGASLESAIEMFAGQAATATDAYWREYFGKIYAALVDLA